MHEPGILTDVPVDIMHKNNSLEWLQSGDGVEAVL